MYNYQQQRPLLFTEEGQLMFIKIRDKVKALITVAGCFRMDSVLSMALGDIWMMIACVDRMVELGELKEVTESEDTAGQHRIFTTK